MIKGKVSGGDSSFTLWAGGTATGTESTFSTEADNNLAASRVDFYDPMEIKWY